MTDESDIDTLEQNAIANDDEGGEDIDYDNDRAVAVIKLREGAAALAEAIASMDETWDLDDVETVRSCLGRIRSLAPYPEDE